MSKRIKINYQRILRLKEELRSVSRHELKDIEWINDEGEIMNPSTESIEEFRFTGLRNCDFPEVYPQEFTKK